MTKQYRDQEDSISVFSVLTFPFRLILKLVWLILSSPVRFWRFLNRRPDPHVIGEKYERKICRNLKRHGFHHIYHTPPSGDHGVDIIAFKNGYSFAIQCKYYSYPVGNRAVQEVLHRLQLLRLRYPRGHHKPCVLPSRPSRKLPGWTFFCGPRMRFLRCPPVTHC